MNKNLQLVSALIVLLTSAMGNAAWQCKAVCQFYTGANKEDIIGTIDVAMNGETIRLKQERVLVSAQHEDKSMAFRRMHLRCYDKEAAANEEFPLDNAFGPVLLDLNAHIDGLSAERACSKINDTPVNH